MVIISSFDFTMTVLCNFCLVFRIFGISFQLWRIVPDCGCSEQVSKKEAMT